MDFLVGYTGFVGSNLALTHEFDGRFNSKNVSDAFGKEPDLLVYAGVPAEMFLANQAPEKDKEVMDAAIENIRRIRPKKLVLISTIAVYANSVGANEDTVIDEKELLPYGKNRRYLEKWAEENAEDCLIVRLPALYGENLKKNFLYDYIHFVPALLKAEKYRELLERDNGIQGFYEEQGNGFYRCRLLKGTERHKLVQYFKHVGFSALNFTDSRAEYQFYNLKNLWGDIQKALRHHVPLMNLATEPVAVSELYYYLTGGNFVNELDRPVLKYDFRTKYAEMFSGDRGYLWTKDAVLKDVKNYVEKEKEKLTEK